jgi:hypothetical protein
MLKQEETAMDKNAIKKYAVWARRELISRVSQRAALYGITEEAAATAGVDSVGGRVLSKTEQSQRDALIEKITAKGYQQVMEEVAYTWFNRFIALRFMEVNEYLPSRVRVFTDVENNFKPQIMTEAINLELEGLDMKQVYALKNSNQDEALFKYLIITQCNALGAILPGMFERIADYTELLFPDNLLREGSVVHQLVTMIPLEDWKDQVQIIGWLYQYYNTEPKDAVFGRPSGQKIKKEEIPAATQLFTPDWIVRYMVENSLGRLWVEGHPDNDLKSQWNYYLEEAEQEPEVEAQLAEIRKDYAALTPEKIKCIDPCCGSGHILVYLFDVLMQIYEDYGYSARDAVRSILENNLYGLDIDDRAAQLSYFAVMMKAAGYDSRFLRRRDIPQPHIYAIRESNGISATAVDYFCNQNEQLTLELHILLEELRDAKEYGSILNISQVDFSMLYDRFDEIFDDFSMYRTEVLEELLPLVQQAEAMAQKYDVVVTNPPYMGGSGMDADLSKYVKDHYPDSKADMFAVFIERCREMAKENGYQAMITQHAWMFLSSFEKLRTKLQTVDTINMAHLGARAFEEIGGEVVQTTSFVLRKSHVADYKGTYCRLIDPTTQQGKEDMFLAGENRYTAQQDNFSKIPGSPVAYWVSEAFFKAFDNDKIEKYAISDGQTKTGNNDKYLRLLWEVDNQKIGKGKKWVLHAKGGPFRRWFGNVDTLIDWSEPARNHYRADHVARIAPEYIWFRKGICWTLISSSKLHGFRLLDENSTFNLAAPSIFFDDEDMMLYILGFLNTKFSGEIISLLNPTLNTNISDITSQPLIYQNVERKADIIELVNENIRISRADWDSFETSWDFQKHPLVRWSKQLWDATSLGCTMATYYHERPQYSSPLELCYLLWKGACNERFQKLKANEEALNRIFIDIYGLQDELTPEVEDKDVTVHYIVDSKDDIPESLKGSNYVRTKRDEIVSLLSYAVGCMFGRYSLDVPGLVYAGGNFNSKYCRWMERFGDQADEFIDEKGELIKGGWAGSSLWKYDGVRKDGHWIKSRYAPDTDNIIPICDDEYFDDDIVGRFVEFVKQVYGEETLEENLRFIADALGGKGSPREVIRNYFLSDFYTDHCKTYQKRPIYWLFDSGRKNGFKCLVYMHRYQPDTIARIRTDYVHEQQSRYRTAIADLENRIAGASTADRVKLGKQLKTLQDQAEETRVYEEKIHHLADQMIAIDLDDGVKHNYALFQDVLAKIK